MDKVNRTHTVLKSEPTYEYRFYISDSSEIKIIERGNFNIFPNEEIIAYGNTKLSEKTAIEVLESPKFIINLYSNKTEKTWKCYCCPDELFNKIGHRTAINAWDCLMVKLGNPEFGIITKFKKYDTDSV